MSVYSVTKFGICKLAMLVVSSLISFDFGRSIRNSTLYLYCTYNDFITACKMLYRTFEIFLAPVQGGVKKYPTRDKLASPPHKVS